MLNDCKKVILMDTINQKNITQVSSETLLKNSKERKLSDLYASYSEVSHPFSDFCKNKIVPGVGNVNSRLLFLGEGPGRDEDISGIPFVGRAGQLLDKIIVAMGLERKDVYITNVVKCRLPNNRPPTDDEIEIEKRLILDAELEVLKPEIICTLGASATKAMLGLNAKISKERGNFTRVKDFLVIPTYHPAYLLRNPGGKVYVWQDMQKILQYLKQ